VRQRFFVIAAVAVGFLLCLAAQPAVSADVPATPTVSYADFSAIDAALAAQGVKARVYRVDYTTRPDSGQYGGTIFARNVGNKQLGSHWVPNDPRRFGNRNISYAIDGTELAATGVPSEDGVIDAIDQAMGTWNGVACSTIPIVKADDYGLDLGYVQYLAGYGGLPGWVADISHAGWLPAAFFDEVAPGGSEYIIGVTYTFVWVTATGQCTDVDRNAKCDVAFREIYYNNYFLWSLDGPAWNDPEIDVETIVLHETGHGLSQGHFGKMFVDASDKLPPYSVSHLHFSPRAVMNAVYWDTQRSLLGSDVAGHCSIWGAWPLK
jgi:hypothetical protein